MPQALSDPGIQAVSSTDAFSRSLLLIHCTNFQFAATVRSYLWSAIHCIFDISTILIATGPTLMWITATCTLNLNYFVILVTLTRLFYSEHRNITEKFLCVCVCVWRTNHIVSVEISQSRSHGHSLSRCGWSAAPLWSSPMTAARHRSLGAS